MIVGLIDLERHPQEACEPGQTCVLRVRPDLQTSTHPVIAMDPGPLSGHLDGRAARLAGILAVAAILAAVFNTVRSYARLRHIPGPRLAALTNLVRRSWVKTGDAHRIHTDLHRRYGTVVRFGPDAVMVSQPEAIDKIYGFKTRFQKACRVFFLPRCSCVGNLTTLTAGSLVRVLRCHHAPDEGRQDSRRLRHA